MLKHHVLAVLGYVAATLLVQGTSHLVINAAHYAAVPHIKPEPIFALGVASMIIQGSILSLVHGWRREPGARAALVSAWLFGAFLVSYIALAEAAKYAVPSIPAWIAVEVAVGAIQFTVIGLLLHLAHRGRAASSSPTPS